MLDDISHNRRCRENDSGRRVVQHRINTLIAGAPQRNQERYRDKSGLQCSQKRNDVTNSLRR
jgi:hypothetical protein